jgi:membrane-bound metal-dependent hydrolase YbcI (DUF457 family)
MDPVSHVVFGRTLIAALERPDRPRFGPAAGAAAILGALSPDVDSVLMPVGWDVYLRFHEIGTHSILGAILVGAAAAAVVRLFAGRATYRALAAAAIVGAFSHLVFDVLSGARLHAAWPFDNTRVSFPLVAMADPWLIAILATGSIVMWMKRRSIRRPAVALLAALAMFLSIKGVLYRRALAATTGDSRTASVASRVIEARWGSWSEWLVFDRGMTALQAWRVNGWNETIDLELSWPMTRESTLITASRSLDTVRNFLNVHDLGFAIEQPSATETTVLWSDVRYCSQQVPGDRTIACGLWFGGVVSPSGQPIRELVKLGMWTQTRKRVP